MYTETFTFFLGHYCLDSFVFPPFIFKSFYQVGTAVCRSCGCVTTNIWEMSRSWTGVGWELDGSWTGVGRELDGSWPFLQASTREICPYTAPLSPYQHPRALIPYRYPGPILRISWVYIDHIFTLYIGPFIFSEHFQHTLTISSPHLHNILTTPPKQ